jgi:uncharacterized protein
VTKQLATSLQPQSLAEALLRRRTIEAESERTGKTFRRHPERIAAERLFLKPALEFGLGITGLYQRGIQNALRPAVRNIKLDFPNLPPAFDGYRLLHLADLHIDAIPGLASTVSALIEDLPVDLCLMTGDYRFGIEGPCEEACAGMNQIVSSVSASDGIYATLGNHDPCEIAYALEQMGVHMLINDAIEVRKQGQALWIAGIDDSYDYRCDDLAAALAPVSKNAFEILLAHAPDRYSEAACAGVDLYLCGHTHAGQIRLPLIGSVISNSSAPREFTSGYWRYRDMQGYTSAGVGCSMLPVRFNCPPEIICIELHAAPAMDYPS